MERYKQKLFVTASTAGRTPLWYHEITTLLQSQNCLPSTYRIPVSTHMKGSDLTFPTRQDSRKEFVSIWNPLLNRAMIGRIISKPSSDTIIIEHWIFAQNQSSVNNPVISTCHGCQINNPDFNSIDLYNRTLTSQCANLYTAQDAILIPGGKHVLQKNLSYRLNSSIQELLQWAEYHMLFLYNQIPFERPQCPSSTIDLQNNILLKYTYKGPIQKELHRLQHLIANSTQLEFYTDGSVFDLGTDTTSASFAFVQTHFPSPKIEFKLGLNWGFWDKISGIGFQLL
jgi:hypothetical protein